MSQPLASPFRRAEFRLDSTKLCGLPKHCAKPHPVLAEASSIQSETSSSKARCWPPSGARNLLHLPLFPARCQSYNSPGPFEDVRTFDLILGIALIMPVLLDASKPFYLRCIKAVQRRPAPRRGFTAIP